MNNLNIKLVVSGDIYHDEINDNNPSYDPELDNITSAFSDICDALSLQPVIKFAISGFGQDTWPLDVKTDLLCGVEELGEIVKKISMNDYNFIFDLYEQGVERTIEFSSNGNDVQVTCSTYTDWKPEPSVIVMSKDDVKKIFYELKFNFCSIAEKACPKLSSHTWFKQWSLG